MNIQQVPLRPNTHVMRLSQMGSMFPTRISFMRSLLRQLMAEKAQVTRPVWDIDADGFGRAVYSVTLGGQVYSLFAISQDLPADQRTDRVIANAWDAAFVLYDGVPEGAELDRLATNAPLQEAGRFGERDLCLSRANKSVRLFAAVAKALQDDSDLPLDEILSIGYLMRTTAVYGNGKFGLADRARVATRPGLTGPFMAEMLTVWLIRTFTHDLVEHVGGKPLPAKVKHQLGIGNSTGLGMAPFLVSHPLLLNAWMETRETALARVLAARVSAERAQTLVALAAQAGQHLQEWNVPDPEHQANIEDLRRDWAALAAGISAESLQQNNALRMFLEKAAAVSSFAEELAAAWMLEPFGDLIDDLIPDLATPDLPKLDPSQTCEMLLAQCNTRCQFALGCDFDSVQDTAQFWYVSEAKLEPRLGQRHAEPGADRESPLDIARQIHDMAYDLDGHTGPLWQFLAQHPQHRFAAERVQAFAANPYSEIQANLIGADTAPIDMLRCKLSFFGATKFDPKSRLWTRITLGQGAPLAPEVADGSARDNWWLPVFAT